jgi:hypothetical protein
MGRQWPQTMNKPLLIKSLQPLTLSGWVMIVMTAGLFYWSLHLRDVVLWISAISLAAYLLYVFLAGLWAFLAIRQTVMPHLADMDLPLLECHKEQPTGMNVPRWAAPPLIGVSVVWKEPGGVTAWINSRGQEMVTPLRRGWASHVIREIEVADLFRLIRFKVEAVTAHPVTILPASRTPDTDIQFGAGKAGEVFSMTGKPEGDRFNLRGYIPGDPLKFVMWHRMTPDGQHYVRLPETVEAPHVTILFLVGEADDASAELARFLIETEPMGSDWSLRVSTFPETVSSQGEALSLLARSGNQRHANGDVATGCQALAEVVRNSQGVFTVLMVPDYSAVGDIGASLISLCDLVLCGESRSDEFALQHPGIRRIKMQGRGGAI